MWVHLADTLIVTVIIVGRNHSFGKRIFASTKEQFIDMAVEIEVAHTGSVGGSRI